MPVVHAARRLPFRPETSWSVEGGEIVERERGRERRYRLADLKRVRRDERGAVLTFGRGRMAIPSGGFGRGLALEDRSASLDALVKALGRPAEPAPLLQAAIRAQPVLWVIGVMGLGVLLLGLAAAVTAAWALSLALAARLVFVLILAAAILPWLGRAR